MSQPSALQVALRLGRVSNVPTVWTNVAAGMALAGASLRPSLIVLLGLAVSLFYVGGMYLNDAFDRRWDAERRAARPIPAGDVAPAKVFTAGFALLAAGLGLLALIAAPRPQPMLAGLALAGLIVLYDVWHKGNPVAPFLMASCRAMIYVIAGWTGAGALRPLLALGAVALLAHVAALSVIARKEAGDPRLPARVALLIAAICLLDGALLALTRNFAAVAVAVACFFLTRRLQRRVAGT